MILTENYEKKNILKKRIMVLINLGTYSILQSNINY